MQGRKGTWAALLGLVVFLSASAHGQVTNATGTIQAIQQGSQYKYLFTLTNTGQTPLETFWFAWFPGYDLLPSAPLNFTAPTGWIGVNADDSFGSHNSAQWYTFSNPLQPGDTLSGFSFTSTDTPTVMFSPGTLDTYVYTVPPPITNEFSNFGFFQPAVVTPEPGCAALLATGLGTLLVRRSRR